MDPNAAPSERAVTSPWLGKVFAFAVVLFFIMVAFGVMSIFYYQKHLPRPEPLPFVDPKTFQTE